ncbi:unnamed protein product [Arctia plantaginis]|uniref:Uncharacterized protein n=1 Tax=Arctia plantaginis TaxID=874455 RepID=A0A8S0ZS10_ARCPL|nr:unnamed protein product [Arctia plantaginis]
MGLNTLFAENHYGRLQTPCGLVIHATHPLTHEFTAAASLHRATIAGPGNVVTKLRLWSTDTARAPAQARSVTARRDPACGVARLQHEGVFARFSQDAAAQVTHGRSAVRCGADKRLHGLAPTHDSLRRNDEAAGYARALYDAASRISPTRNEISRLGG